MYIFVIAVIAIMSAAAILLPCRVIMDIIRYDLGSLAMNIVFSIIDARYRSKNKLIHPQNRKDHVALVTGGGRGIGPEIVKLLMKNKMNVVIAVRKPAECEEVMKAMRIECPEGSVCAMALDVSSMNSIQDFCRNFLSRYSKLHILVNNAGIYFGGFKLTSDGFEEKFATNYLGHFLLTHLLMSTMEKSAEGSDFYSRVVHVSSCYHFNGTIFFDDINLKNSYAEGKSYCQSKLAQLMFSNSLDRMLVNDNLKVRSLAVHPGMVASDMYKTGMAILGPFFEGLTKYVKSPAEGGTSVAFACLSPTLERTGGKYLSNCMEATPSQYSQSKIHQERLFKMSMDMLKIEKFGLTHSTKKVISSVTGKD